MKIKRTLTVICHIQMDVTEGRELADAVTTLDLINKIVSMSELESQPQIFTNNIDDNDLLFEDGTEEA